MLESYDKEIKQEEKVVMPGIEVEDDDLLDEMK